MTGMLLAVLQTLLAGLPAAMLTDPRPTRRRLLGLAFLLGAGIVHLVLLAFAVAGVPWTRAGVTAALLGVTVPLWVVALRRGVRFERSRWHAIDAATFALLLVHGLVATRAPVGEWDFWSIWGLKARVFFVRGSLDWSFLGDPFASFSHPGYPVLLPLNYVFAALHESGWTDRWLGILTTLFGAAVVLIVRDSFERELPAPALAALATLGAASVATARHIGTGEAPMIAFSAAGLLFLRRGSMAAGALLLGFAACTKNEGVALIAAVAVALLLSGRKGDVVRLWPALAVAAPWLVLRRLHALPGQFSSANVFENVARIPDVLATIAGQRPVQPLFWLAMGVAFVVFFRGIARERFLVAAVVIQFLSYLGAYLATSYDMLWHIRFSWPRLLQHAGIPLAFVALSVTGRAILLRQRADHGGRDGDQGDDHEDRDDDRGDHGGDGHAHGDEHDHLHQEHDRENREEQDLQREQRHLEGELHH